MWIKPQLLLLLCALPAVLGCDGLRQYRHFTTTSIRLLDTMDLTEEESPVPSPVPFPDELYEQIETEKVKQAQVDFVRDALHLMSRLIKRLNVSEETNPKLEKLQMLLFKQDQDLEHCIPKATKKRVNTKLRKYFRKLQRRLLSSWPLLLKETRDHLLQLDLLVVSINRHVTSH